MPTPRYCLRCDLPLRITVLPPGSTHHARRDCPTCGFKGFEPAPMTVERAANFVLPIGKYRGETVEQVASDATGLDYLRWVARNIENRSIKRAVAYYLASRLMVGSPKETTP